MKGYKVFEPDWTCRGFQYEVGETYEEDVTPSCCNIGFHFCTELIECFNYYSFDPNNKVAEIEALGEIDAKADGSKCCTNKIKIVREISWEEVLKKVNTGKANTGYRNSGDYNSGYRNSGNYNSGNFNSGYRNSGNYNSGDYNSGDYNSGNCNSGNYNSGNYNSGNRNSGNRNSGDYNSGDYNSGYFNSGYRNSGNRNSGNRNSGNCNSGDFNKTNYSNGCFNTKEPKIFMFNKPSDWTFEDWYYSEARHLLCEIQHKCVKWIMSDEMTDEEKEQHPEHKTTGGYLKELDESECGQIWWDSLSAHEKEVIKSLPNFDSEIFEQVTGVHIK